MKLSIRNNAGLTQFEVIVALLLVVLMFAIILAMLLPVEAAANRRAQRLGCVNNLKQMDEAALSWEGNPGSTSFGISGLAGLNSGQKAWIDFAGESNLLASSKILRCPADRAMPSGPPGFNLRISYFLNTVPKKPFPKLVLFGDDNLTIGLHAFGLDRPPGSMGVAGNADLPLKAGMWEIPTNLPVAWDITRHDYFIGNAAFTDGSVSELSSCDLVAAFQQSGVATNRLAIP